MANLYQRHTFALVLHTECVYAVVSRMLTENRPSVTSRFVSFVQESQFFHHYELCLSGPPLGEGSFSVCRKCQHKQSGRDYAVKIVSRRLEGTSGLVFCLGCLQLHGLISECLFSLLEWRQTHRGRSLR